MSEGIRMIAPENLRKYAAMGTEGTLYSCKYFGGPNTAGILVGTKSLIKAVALHSFIGQEGASAGKQFISEAQRGAYSSLFRGYKQDRGSIVGGVVALEKYMKTMEDPERNVLVPAEERAKYLMNALGDIPDIELEVLDASMEGIDPLKIALKLTMKKKTPEEVKDIRDELINGDPEIWLEAKDNSLIINVTSFRGLMMFSEGDKDTLVDSVKKVLLKNMRV
jgi:hypothetical protein